ncbi:MAG: peptidoglycan-binding protein, partial [Methyloprofundus sp.]|nr:peptidoglycan-binding protein [Methyloprofundus sp.]
MKLTFSTTLLLIWTLLCPLAHAASSDNRLVNFSLILNSKNHPYFLKPYTEQEHITLQALYQFNQNQLLWQGHRHSPDMIEQLLELLNNAALQGLNKEDYASHYLNSQWQKLQQATANVHQQATFDTALSLIFLRYLNDLHYGRVDPKQLGFSLAEKNPINFSSHIYDSIQTDSIHTLAKLMEPKLLPYQHLKKSLAQYKRLNQHFVQAVHFDFKQSLHPGDSSPQISDLEYYLDILNTPENQPIPSKIPNPSTLYTDNIAEKVRQLQTRHNLLSDGIIGKQTLKVLNTPLSKRITQIELAMERLRWLPEQQ